MRRPCFGRHRSPPLPNDVAPAGDPRKSPATWICVALDGDEEKSGVPAALF